MTGIETLSEPAEQITIAAAQQGDRQAFSKLVLRYQDGVINVVYRMCGNTQLAEEAAQEAFLRAWQNLDRYNPRFAFRNWVYRIALNATLDYIRREPQLVEIEQNHLVDESTQPEQSFDQKQRRELVRREVLALPVASREVLVLREYEDLSYQEIADTLNIPLGTVMSRLNYARNQLRRALLVDLEER